MSPSRRDRRHRTTPATPVSARRRRVDRRRRQASRRRKILVLLIVPVVLLMLLAGGGDRDRRGLRVELRPRLAQARHVGSNSFIYAADGSRLGSIPAERNSQPVTLAEMSQFVPAATVAIEDRRFYEHGGIDVAGIVRALFADVRAGKVVQGGSTITQQLVRNLYDLSQERTVSRKLKEACLAVKVDRSWSKQRILTGVHELRLLRQSRLRDRGRLADVLLQAGEGAQPARVGAARRPAAGALRVRSVQAAEESARAARRGAAGAAQHGRDHARQYRRPRRATSSVSRRAASTPRSRSRTSSATSATCSSRSTAPRRCGPGACASTRRSTGGSSASPTA